MSRFRRGKAKEPEDSWSVSTTTFEGSPLIIRLNNASTKFIGIHNIQVGVAIPLNQPVPGGLPTPEEDAQLGAIEEVLVAQVGNRAVLAAVLTTGTMREFVLYTAADEWIEQLHGSLDEAITTHEVQVVAKNDADWSVYKSLAGE